MKFLLFFQLIMFITLSPARLAGQNPARDKNMTASKIIETIIKSTGSPVIPDKVNGS
jgi:hypothetical protein